MLCGVTATLGSNPSATATAARPQWGRAVLLCLDGVWARVLGPGCLVCLARPGCLVCPWAAARPRAVRAASFARRVASKPGQAPPPPTGPAAWPSGTLHTGGACVAVCGWVRRLEARPGPAAAHGHRSLALRTFHTGGACVAVCGWVRRLEARPGSAPPTGTAAWPSGPSTPAALVSLCVAGCVVSKPGQALPPPTGTAADGFHSLAQQVLRCPPCWSCKPPSGAVRSRLEVVSCPKCRPPRRKTLKTGCYGRSGLRFGHVGTCHSALHAREPAIASGNPLCRT